MAPDAMARARRRVHPLWHDGGRIPQGSSVARNAGARVAIPCRLRSPRDGAACERDLDDAVEMTGSDDRRRNGVAVVTVDGRRERRTLVHRMGPGARPGVISSSVARAALAAAVAEIGAP